MLPRFLKNKIINFEVIERKRTMNSSTSADASGINRMVNRTSLLMMPDCSGNIILKTLTVTKRATKLSV